MSDWQLFGAGVVALIVVAAVWLMIRHWRRTWEARLAVLTAWEDETARHVPSLVPAQRQPVDPFWAEFIETQRDGEDR
ncbi:hypothetical protein AMIS_21460 [Actinoplanes missouriensis 431]|uniref:Uncharacterized protein n=1 Tax=Actinoplanes missouriensis (strain ATCC 14538 / DSM 43046 / CBS 188.64 / JCM 3121 / NBRC 102363 / NCIMB 12654 / NRRL B-3342 / UNCC 431) TaxID=512565 RepID=I0H2X9_ACTM4|nr:hypothetical protein [Actinoplanes missouriensis]BAL87366.1 hypothetical protein AMIS_21460 [Actinoplanes missouriensis 431]